MAAYAYIRPGLGLQQGSEYQPTTVVPESPGAVFFQGEFISLINVGTLVYPTPAGSLATFQPTSAPTVNTSGSASANNPSHTLFAWYTLLGTGGQGVIESLPYEIGPIVNAYGFNATVTVPADGNYPAAANHFALYVGTLPGQQWSQVASTTLGSAATIPAFPLTNNSGYNRAVNNPSSTAGLVYANYDAGSGFAQRLGYLFSSGYDWRALFGTDQSLSGVQPLYEQYAANITKLGQVPIALSLKQAWNNGLVGAVAGLVFSTQYNCWYADTAQTNTIFTIDRLYGGIQGPYNPIGGVNDTGAVVIGHLNAGYLA